MRIKIQQVFKTLTNFFKKGFILLPMLANESSFESIHGKFMAVNLVANFSLFGC